VTNKFYLTRNKNKTLFNLTLSALLNEAKLIIKNNKPFSALVRALFIFIIFNNFLGLFPYIFTRTRHITVTLVMSSTI
jgi:F-type H+-transporting ATPase subunit a